MSLPKRTSYPIPRRKPLHCGIYHYTNTYDEVICYKISELINRLGVELKFQAFGGPIRRGVFLENAVDVHSQGSENFIFIAKIFKKHKSLTISTLP